MIGTQKNGQEQDGKGFNMLNYVSLAVPAATAKWLTPQRLCVAWCAVTKAVCLAQAKKVENPKAQAHTWALNDFDLQMQVMGHDADTDQYVTQNLLPAMIEGAVLAFDLSLFFSTSKAVDVGGKNNPVAPSALSRIPGPRPQVEPGGPL